MKILLVILGVLLTLAFLGATIFLFIKHPENQTAWGWMMFLSFCSMTGTYSLISDAVKKLP